MSCRFLNATPIKIVRFAGEPLQENRESLRGTGRSNLGSTETQLEPWTLKRYLLILKRLIFEYQYPSVQCSQPTPSCLCMAASHNCKPVTEEVGDDLAPTEGWGDRGQNCLHDMRVVGNT
jgi:hypothetical protein